MTNDQLLELIKLQREASKHQQETLQLHQEAFNELIKGLRSMKEQITKLEARIK